MLSRCRLPFGFLHNSINIHDIVFIVIVSSTFLIPNINQLKVSLLFGSTCMKCGIYMYLLTTLVLQVEHWSSSSTSCSPGMPCLGGCLGPGHLYWLPFPSCLCGSAPRVLWFTWPSLPIWEHLVFSVCGNPCSISSCLSVELFIVCSMMSVVLYQAHFSFQWSLVFIHVHEVWYISSSELLGSMPKSVGLDHWTVQ
jgi:hypothetical protein